MEIECLPKGICSSNYVLRGEGITGNAWLNWGNEQGQIAVNGALYQIEKMGFFSSRWVMLRNGLPVCQAKKTSIVTRTIEMEGTTGKAILHSTGFVGRSMRLTGPGGLCDIMPVHPFTRRARISGCWNQGLEIAVFAFWLTAMLWRRQSNSVRAS